MGQVICNHPVSFRKTFASYLIIDLRLFFRKHSHFQSLHSLFVFYFHFNGRQLSMFDLNNHLI